MEKRLLILIFLYLALSWKVTAIDFSQYRFHAMPETSYYGGIQSIAKDSLGRVWYTGPDAIFVYDGNNFRQLNELVSITEPASKWRYGMLVKDKVGRLFLTTNHGLLTIQL